MEEVEEDVQVLGEVGLDDVTPCSTTI